MPKLFDTWRSYSQVAPNWRHLFQSWTVTDLTEDVLDAYEAPFPTEAHRAGSRAFPVLVPESPSHDSVEENQGAWRRFLRRWRKPFLTCFSDCDVVIPGAIVARQYQKEVPGARGVAHTLVRGAGHYLQEDKGEELAGILVAFCRAHPQQLNPPPRPPQARL